MFQIGATLREARVRRGLSLQQAEDDTKIRVKYLQAMENDEFDVLPAPAYVKGFLRTYATYLGLNADIILDEYRSRYEPHAEHHPFEGSSALQPRRAGRRRSGLVFVAIVAVLILLLIYLLGLRGGEKPSQTGPTLNPSVLVSMTPSASASAHPSPSPSQTSPTATTRTVLRLSASSPTWVEVRRGSLAATPAYAGSLTAGISKEVSAEGTLYVTIGGDPANVTMTVDGAPVHTAGDRSGTVYVIAKGRVTKH